VPIVVDLAGNLARDEASELTAEILKSRPAAGTAALAPVAPGAEARAEAEANLRDEQTLARMLAEGARRDRSERITVSIALIVVGAGDSLAAPLYGQSVGAQRAYEIVAPLGLPLIFIGIFGVPFLESTVGLTRQTTLERLSAYYPPGSEPGRPWARAKVEAMWKDEAANQHRELHVGTLAVIGGLALAQVGLAGALYLAERDAHRPGADAVDLTALGLGTIGVAACVAGMLSETSTESRLRDYERAVGRTLPEPTSFGVAPVRGSGAALTFTGRF
jgi:hypothetical protein